MCIKYVVAIFYDEVYYPHIARFMAKVKRWNIFQTEWEPVELGYYLNIDAEWPVEWEVQDVVGDRMQYYLEPIWNGFDWSWPEPTVEECSKLIDIAEDYPLVQQTLF